MNFLTKVMKFFEQVGRNRVERELAMHNFVYKLDK